MRAMIIAAGSVFWALGVMAQPPEAQPPVMGKYSRTGTYEKCLPLSGIKRTEIATRSSVVFYMHDGAVYVNDLPSCASLRPQIGSFTYDTALSKLCDTDIITTLEPQSSVPRSGSCGLGSFERLEEKKPGQ